MNREPDNPLMKRHLNNLKRSAGIEYKAVITPEDLTRAWMESRKDLPYALRKEVKRDRFVLNTEGMQKDLEKALQKALTTAAKDLDKLADAVIQDITSSLNSLTVINNQFVPKKAPGKFNMAAEIGRILGTVLAKSTTMIFEDMTRRKNRRR